MADTLAKMHGIGYDGDRKITADLESLQRLLKMESQEFEALCAMAGSKRTDVEEFFQITS
jgi:hypothetical protein